MSSRIRLVLAATFLALVGTFAFAGVAGAQEATTTSEVKYADKESEECAKLLEEGKTPDDCQEAPSPILPAANELIWGGISFVVLLLLLSKFAFPALKKGMPEQAFLNVGGADDVRAKAERLQREAS